MAVLLRGAPAADTLDKRTLAAAAVLKAQGILPTLAILRVGERESDLSYERGAVKRCEKLGVAVRRTVLPESATQAELLSALGELDRDATVHGVLLLRPLPGRLDERAVCAALSPEKDVDGCTAGSMARVYSGSGEGFAPCTAQACMELLSYYGVQTAGRRAAVVGRSLVTGRPAALLLTAADATVTLCHTRTADLRSVLREADIVIVCTGRMESIGRDCFRPGQTVVDVGIGWSAEKGKFCGDVRFGEVEPIVAAITPVPGGVGGVTTSVLASHVVEAAGRCAEKTVSV